MRASFVLSEIRIGLRRNITMTIAVVVTVAIALALFGAAMLTRAQVNAMKDFWYDKVEVSIFLDKNVTQPQRDQLSADLNANPEVKQVYYESQQQAYDRFKQQFRDSPDLVKNVTPDALPESFRVKLKNPQHYEIVASAFRDRPGVQEVNDQRRLLDRFFKILNGFKLAALLVAGVMLVAAVLMIYNTIRIAAFSRRRETGIMRLVGASNLYIQLPFLLEGAVAGLIGAVVASAFLSVFLHFFIDGTLKRTFTFTPFIGWDALGMVVVYVVVLGVALSAMASFATLRRHLRV